MSKLPPTTRTGRLQLGPGSDLVELQGDDGQRCTAIVFHPEYRAHNALRAALGVVLGFLESPMVSGLEDLVAYDLEESTFLYRTGQAWSAAEVVRTLADAGESAGVRAGVELLVRAGRILVEAAEAGEAAAIYSHGGVTPWRVMLDAEGRVRVIGHALPQVEILVFHANPGQVPREDAFRYCPPERMEARKENWSSDVFGLALVAFELMTGLPVYDGLVDEIRGRAARGETSRRIHQHRELLPESVRELLTTALRAEFRDRYASGAEFLEAAERALRDPSVTGPTLREVATRVAASPTRARQALDPAKTSMLSRDELRKMMDDEDTAPPPRRETVRLPPARTETTDAPAAPPPARPNPRVAGAHTSGDTPAPRAVLPTRAALPAAPPAATPEPAARALPPARANPRASTPPEPAPAEPTPVATPPGAAEGPPRAVPPARANPRAPVPTVEAPAGGSAPPTQPTPDSLLARLRQSGGGEGPDPAAGYEAAAAIDRMLRQSGNRPAATPPDAPHAPAASALANAGATLPATAQPPAAAASALPPLPPPIAPPRPTAPTTITGDDRPPIPAEPPPAPARGPRFVALDDDDDDDAGSDDATAAFVRGRPVTPPPAEPPPDAHARTASNPAVPPPPVAPATVTPPAITRAAVTPTAEARPTRNAAMTSTMRGEQVPFRLARTGAPTQRRRLPAETTLAELVALLLAQALPLPVGLDGTLDAAWCAGDANGPLPGATPLASLGEEPTVHLHRIPARRVRARVRAKHPAGVRTGVLVAHTGVPGASLLEGLLDALDLDGAWTLVHAGMPVGPFDTLASRIGGAADDPIDLELVPA